MKLGDFGLAVQLEHAWSQRSGESGTPLYMGPEVYEGETVLKSDVWALGISIIEMAERRNPFAGCTWAEVKKQVMLTSPPRLSSSGWSSDLVDFVDRCLVKDVNNRASVEELMKVSDSEMA